MNISIYDFDGTIYKGDSSIDYALCCIKNNPVKIMILPIFILFYLLYKVHFVQKETAKSWLFRMMDDSSRSVKDFWKTRNGKFIDPVVKMLKEDDLNGFKILVISASPMFLVSQAMQYLDIPVTVIATDTETSSPHVFLSPNCFGEEKVKRYKKWLKLQDLNQEDIVIKKVVSDSKNDLPLYKLGGNPFYVKHARLMTGIAS